MKNSKMELNSIFSVADEMKPGNGEDCLYYEAVKDGFIIASFDGLGGAGSRKYENYSGKTGAYIASRSICGAVKSWYRGSNIPGDLSNYLHRALSTCEMYADKSGRILGSLGKSFPTTIAMLTGAIFKNSIDVTCYWAGDSRCYMLDEKGLHQLTEDDLDDEDAMSNLTNDGIMTNVVSASGEFEIHIKEFSVKNPCILISATDGCFGYLHSPMEFEFLLTNTLTKSKNIQDWKIRLNDIFQEIAGDDYTLCVAVCGFKDFNSVKAYFEQRNTDIYTKYIDTNIDPYTLWEEYKTDYSTYLNK